MSKLEFLKNRQNILKSDFLRHRLYDKYLYAKQGSESWLTPAWFTYFINKYYDNNPGVPKTYQNNFITNIFSDIMIESKIDENNYSILNNYNYNFYLFKALLDTNPLVALNTFKENIKYEDNGITNKFYILTGWRSNITTGHAVSILIEKQDTNDLYTVNIINSGSGFGTFHMDPSNDPNHKNIIIIYKDINILQIHDIIKLSFLSVNPEFCMLYNKQLLIEPSLRDWRIPINKIIPTNLPADQTTVINHIVNVYKYYNNLDKFFNNAPYLDVLKNNQMDGPNFYNYLQKIILADKPIDEYITDEPQWSSSCSYFSTYYTIKHFIFKNEPDLFNSINDYINKDIIKYYIDNINNDDINTYFAYGDNTSILQFNNTDVNNKKYDMNILNMSQIIIKDYHRVLTVSEYILLKKKILCEYLKIDNISNYYNFTQTANEKNYFTEVKELYNAFKINNPPNILIINSTPRIFNDFNLILDKLLEFNTSIIDKYSLSIGKLFILYILIRSLKFFKEYFTKNTTILIESNIRILKKIFENIKKIDVSIILDKDLSISHSAMINLRLLNIILPILPEKRLTNEDTKKKTITPQNLKKVFSQNFMFRPYFNIDFNIEEFENNLNNKEGWIIINHLIDITNFIKPTWDIGIEQSHSGEFNIYDSTLLTNYDMNNINILLYNINQINSNNYNKLELPLPITGSKFFSNSNNSKYSNLMDIFENDFTIYNNPTKYTDNAFYSISGNDYYNRRNEHEFYSYGQKFNLYNKHNTQNENYHIQKSLIQTLNIKNLLKNHKLINKILIDQLFFLLMIHRRDEVDQEINDYIKLNIPNNIISHIFNCDYKEIDLINPFSLYYVLNNKEILNTNNELKKLYENYYILDSSSIKRNLFEEIDNNEINNNLRNELINMIIASIFMIKDDNYSYDKIFFDQFMEKILYKSVIKIENYDNYNLEGTELTDDVHFLDYPLYRVLPTTYYYNKEFNYLTQYQKETNGANTNIFKNINGQKYLLVSDSNLSTIFSDKKIVIHLCQRIMNFSKIYIWTDTEKNNIYIELINFDKIHFKLQLDNGVYIIKYLTNHAEQLEYDEITKTYKSLTIPVEYIVEEKYENNGDNINVENTNTLFGIWKKGAVNHFIISDKNEYYLLIFFSNSYINNFILKNPNEKPKADDLSNQSYNNLYWNYNLESDDFFNKYNKVSNKLYKIKLHPTFLYFDEESSLYLPLLNSLILSKNNLGIFIISKTLSTIINRLYIKDSEFEELEIFKNLIKFLDAPLAGLYNKLFLLNTKEIKEGYIKRKDLYSYNDLISISDLNINIDEINKKRLVEICRLSDNLTASKKDFTENKKEIFEYPENKTLKNYITNFRGNCNKEKLCNNKDIFDISDLNISNNVFDSLLNFNKLPLISNIYITFRNYFYNNLIKSKFITIYDKVNKLLNEGEECDCFSFAKEIAPLDYKIIYELEKDRKIEDIIFEIQYSNFIRAEQKEMLYTNDSEDINKDKIIDDLNKNTNNKIYEILMGRGKTAVITPLIILNQYFTPGTNLSSLYVVLPKQLVQTSFDILSKLSDLISNIDITTYERKNKNIINNELFKESNILSIVSDEIIKEYILDSIIKSPTNNIPTNIFPNKNLFIFDEIDSLIDPFKSDLNKPTNPIDHKYHDFLVEHIYNIMQLYYLSEDKEDIDKIINNATDIYFVAIEDSLKDLVKQFKIKMKQVIKIINGMHYNQNFGFGNILYKKYSDIINNPEEYKPLFAAIPYSANNSPVNGSEFSDFELAIALTSYTFIINKLRDIDIYVYLNEVLQKYKYNKLLCEKIYPKLINRDIMSIQFLDAYNGLNDEGKIELCKKYSNWKKIKFNKEIRKEYLKIIFNKFFKISMCQSNISMVDVFSHNFCNKKVAFSGSVNINLPRKMLQDIFINEAEDQKFKANYPDIERNLFSQINEDDVVKGAIISSLYGITRNNNILNEIYTFIKQKKKIDDENNFISFIKKYETLKNHQAIIDTAGLIISKPAEVIIKEIFETIQIINMNPPNGIKLKKTLLYVNNDGTRMIYNSDDKIINKKYNNETFTDCFIFYDHKHTVGIDFKQPSKMIGLVSISAENNLTQISQGVYRLRNINIGHNVNFYLESRIIKDIPEDKTLQLRCIIDLLKSNDDNYKILSDYNMKKQCLKFLYRNIFNTKNTYEENVFYDLIEDTNKFYNEEEFNNKLIKDLYAEMNGQLMFKDIKYKEKLVQNTNLTVQLNLVIAIISKQTRSSEFILFEQGYLTINPDYRRFDINIINIHNITESAHGTLRLNIKRGNLNVSSNNNSPFIYNYRSILNNSINLDGGFEYNKIIVVGDWEIGYTPAYLKLLYLVYNTNDAYRIYETSALSRHNINTDFINKDGTINRDNLIKKVKKILDDKLYFIYNEKNPNKITIMTFFDVIAILTDYEKLISDLKIPELRTQERLDYYDCFKDIIIYDKYNNEIFNIGTHKPKLSNIIRLLLMTNNLTIIEKYKAIRDFIKIPNCKLIYIFLKNVLGFNFDFYIYDQNQNLYEIHKHDEYKNWNNIGILDISNKEDQQKIIELICDTWDNERIIKVDWEEILRSIEDEIRNVLVDDQNDVNEEETITKLIELKRIRDDYSLECIQDFKKYIDQNNQLYETRNRLLQEIKVFDDLLKNGINFFETWDDLSISKAKDGALDFVVFIIDMNEINRIKNTTSDDLILICGEIERRILVDKEAAKQLYNVHFRSENNTYKIFTNYEENNFKKYMRIPSTGTFYDKIKNLFEQKYYKNAQSELLENFAYMSQLYNEIIDNKIIEKIDNDKIILYQNLHFLELLKNQILSYEDILYENKEYINNIFNEFKQRIERSDMIYTLEYFDNLFIEIKRVYDLSLVKLDEYCEKYLSEVNDYVEKKKLIEECSKKHGSLLLDVAKQRKELNKAMSAMQFQQKELNSCTDDQRKINRAINEIDSKLGKKKTTPKEAELLLLQRVNLVQELAIITEAVRIAERNRDEAKATYEAMPGYTGGYRKKYLKYKLKYLSLKDSII